MVSRSNRIKLFFKSFLLGLVTSFSAFLLSWVFLWRLDDGLISPNIFAYLVPGIAAGTFGGLVAIFSRNQIAGNIVAIVLAILASVGITFIILMAFAAYY